MEWRVLYAVIGICILILFVILVEAGFKTRIPNTIKMIGAILVIIIAVLYVVGKLNF